MPKEYTWQLDRYWDWTKSPTLGLGSDWNSVYIVQYMILPGLTNTDKGQLWPTLTWGLMLMTYNI